MPQDEEHTLCLDFATLIQGKIGSEEVVVVFVSHDYGMAVKETSDIKNRRVDRCLDAQTTKYDWTISKMLSQAADLAEQPCVGRLPHLSSSRDSASATTSPGSYMNVP